MATDNDSLTGNSTKEKTHEHKYGRLIEGIYEFLNDELLQLFTGMLDKSALSLTEKEERLAQSLSNDSNYKIDEKHEMEIRALKILCKERSRIHTNFFISINEQLLPSNTSAFDDSNNEEELRLVDTDEMEEMVAITTMHSNALNLFGNDVHHFEARIEFLEIMSAPIFEHKSVSPNCICEAFQKAIKPFGLRTENKMVLLKYFDEHVNLKLANLYQTINAMLIEADVLPEVILSSDNEEPVEEKAFESRTVNYYDPQEKIATNFIPRSQSEMNSIVSQFMKGDISVTGDELELPASFYKDPNQQDTSDKRLYARKDVIQSLNRLQKKLLELGARAELVNNKEIKDSLMKEMGIDSNDPGKKEIAILDERSIDFVGMMFDAITNDESISSVISNLILQLQIPMIKVAVNDEELFSNEQHPARNVLNLISHAGKGVTEKNDRVYSELDEIVNKILNEYEIDTACFENAVDTLYDLIENEERLTRSKELEEQRAIIREHTRNVVLSEIKDLTANKIIPKDVQPLVLKNWSTLMFNRHLKHGKESYEWMESVLLLKLLLKCLQPIEQKSQWEFLNNNHSALVEAVNDELYDTRQNKQNIDNNLFSLEKKFLSMLDEFGFSMEESEHDCEQNFIHEPISSDMEQELELARKEAQVALDKISRLPENVKPGVWFEVFNGDDKAVRRVKMSTILTEAAKIIFVDRNGIKIIEKDAADFADELDHNLSRVLADHSTFDHALGKVIGSMAA